MTDPSNAGSELAAIIQENSGQVLADWIELQLGADTLRLDLIDERALRKSSEEFLAALTAALGQADGLELSEPPWAPVFEFLEALAVERDRMGFSPTETATFVFSLKQPLFSRLQQESPKERFLEDMWRVNQLLDRLGLHCVQVVQQRKEATIARQQEEMMELSTPVVQLWDGILALPLIGTLDTGRSQMVTEALLDTIAETGSSIAIIDLTGVPIVDTRMAQYLLRTVAAARLMGAECILSGIRPQIAQTIVHLQIDLGDIITEATLSGALAAAFLKLGRRVSNSEES